MSGGSFDYLCFKEFDELITNKDLIKEMATRLIELGYTDAAKETLQIKYIIEQAQVRVETHIDRLKELWKAVEWLDSGDSEIEQVKKAYKNYQGEMKCNG